MFPTGYSKEEILELLKSQSPLIGAMFPTPDVSRQYQWNLHVSIPSNRGNVSDNEDVGPGYWKVERSQSPLIGAMFPTINHGVRPKARQKGLNPL